MPPMMSSFLGSQIAEYVSARAHSFPRVLWKFTVPQHFDTPLGYWAGKWDGPWTCRPQPFGIDPNGALYSQNSPADGAADGTADGTDAKGRKRNSFTPLAAAADTAGLDVLLRGGYHNLAARRVFEPAGIPVLGGWNDSLILWEMHREGHLGTECSHYCNPSVAQITIYYLYAALRDSGL